MIKLPIEEVLPALKAALQFNTSAVLSAPPGAGKTTRVPLALLDEPWLLGRRILMLEPRRLAARTAARYMAALLGEQTGETVGYRVKLDTRVGAATRIEVVTEGVLTRILQDDPALENVGLVIFDEFHERSIHADLGLALCLQSQAVLRDDLRILVMSATLEADPIAALLGGVPVLSSEGRAFPVETVYLDRSAAGRIEQAAVQAIAEAIERFPGDILVFLPGTGEIRRVAAGLAEIGLGPDVRIASLYGDLPQQEQDRAIAPAKPGERKIVLSTSIAETSLTVEGVRIVIDSGLMRVPRFSPRTGMTRLETVAVSKAASDQRRGRAGRLGPGICLRLWSEAEDRRLAPRSTPEILEADLAPLALELAAWGVVAPAELRWLDPPPAAAYQQARELLAQLGALDGSGALTPHGRRMAELGLHPRLAHMILKAIPLGLGELACELAALLEGRDILRRSGGGAPDADLRLRIEAIRGIQKENISGFSAAGSGPADVDEAGRRRILIEADHWKRKLGIPTNEKEGKGGEALLDDTQASGLLLAFAYPDRIALRRPDGRFLLRCGRGAAFAGMQALAAEPCLVAAELEDQGLDSRILLAAPLEIRDLHRHFADQIEQESAIFWDRAIQAVRARKRVRFGALILQDGPMPDPDPEAAAEALLEGVRQEGLDILPWTRASRQYQQRMQFMRLMDPGWPDVSDSALIHALADWLLPHLHGLKSRADLQRLNLAAILQEALTWNQRRQLDEDAPTHIVVPSGSRIPVDYGDPSAPLLAVRLQEMFGLKQTPMIAGGKFPLTLHLLSPAQRPVQVTRDLASFWQNAYFEVKKDLKGRYPKHYWPDDPLEAQPTKRAKPRL
ncbi:ATP-dependent helicase HrpB [Ferviditalea candida]|uniref:ATP-dependent helicase HrpB n=1 Tax=Ferviditalea candida TaxID=3108399 RepID=A0ABU5ZP62_9BACL|nr:ATP-dependent helicase HrpB [Paenibacillaceae bacterium T2]